LKEAPISEALAPPGGDYAARKNIAICPGVKLLNATPRAGRLLIIVAGDAAAAGLIAFIAGQFFPRHASFAGASALSRHHAPADVSTDASVRATDAADGRACVFHAARAGRARYRSLDLRSARARFAIARIYSVWEERALVRASVVCEGARLRGGGGFERTPRRGAQRGNERYVMPLFGNLELLAARANNNAVEDARARGDITLAAVSARSRRVKATRDALAALHADRVALSR